MRRLTVEERVIRISDMLLNIGSTVFLILRHILLAIIHLLLWFPITLIAIVFYILNPIIWVLTGFNVIDILPNVGAWIRKKEGYIERWLGLD